MDSTTILGLIISIIANVVIIAPVLWMSGRLLAGRKAKFTDALWIVTLGTLVSAAFSYFLWDGIIASLILMIIILGLVKHFFDCGWIKALIISIVAAIIFIIIAAVLAIIGIGIIAFTFI